MASAVGHMFALLSVGLLMLVCVEAVNARIHHREHSNLVSSCSAGNYYDLQSKECRKCSSCPVNEIIRRPCHKHRDTICGPFTEFDRFNQQGDLTADNAAESKNSNAYNGKYNKNAHDKDGQLLKVDVYQNLPSEERGPEKHSPSPDFASVTTDADQQWRLLALVLIGVLSLVSILLVGFVFVACYLLKRRRLVEKTVVCSSDAPATGHYFRPPVFTAERLNPTDHMRALLHVDPESQRDQNAFQAYREDSKCLGNVPVYSDEVDENTENGTDATAAANSSSAVCGSGNQSAGYSSPQGFPEVVPGPSQDYVYFKAPVKHSFAQV